MDQPTKVLKGVPGSHQQERGIIYFERLNLCRMSISHRKNVLSVINRGKILSNGDLCAVLGPIDAETGLVGGTTLESHRKSLFIASAQFKGILWSVSNV